MIPVTTEFSDISVKVPPMDQASAVLPVIETLATGDEVVLGDVLDTNGSWIARTLLQSGLKVSRQMSLPDNVEGLRKGIIEIASRADFCVASGGLGPTDDDLTIAVVASILNVPLREDSEASRRMRERTAKAGIRFSEGNLKSARLPEGATVFQNDAGSAPGFAVRIQRCHFYFLPGVPKEYLSIVKKSVLPDLLERLKGRNMGRVVQLKTLGWAESLLAEEFQDFGARFPRVRVGYRAHAPEVWLKLSSDGSEPSEQELIKALEVAENKLSHEIFAKGDRELVDEVHELLSARQLTFATAESCTGGGIGAAITACPGSSAYYRGGVVTYSDELKTSLLGVDPQLVAKHGAVSAEVAREMAKGAILRLGAQVSVAVTGIAGPDGGTLEKPVGTVHLALGVKNPDGIRIIELKRSFRGDRQRVQRASVLTALEMARRWLVSAPPLKDGSA